MQQMVWITGLDQRTFPRLQAQADSPASPAALSACQSPVTGQATGKLKRCGWRKYILKARTTLKKGPGS